jgi:hypothetical protein
MLSSKVDDMEVPIRCSSCDYQINKFGRSIEVYNHLIFDFDTHQLAVEHLSDQVSSSLHNQCDLDDWIKILRSSNSQEKLISTYRVNIEKPAKEIQGFNHASMGWLYPPEIPTKVDQFSFLPYTFLSHVCSAMIRNNDHVFVLATYGGAVVL